MSTLASLTVQVPLAIRRRPGRKTVVTPEGMVGATTPAPTIPTRADPALVKALARAFRYQKLLDEGRHASITEMAEAEKLDRGYMGRLLQLTLLAPNLVEALLDGRQPEQLGLSSLLKPLPLSWERQGRVEPSQGAADLSAAQSCPKLTHEQ
ncbi:hypothetical protein [Muricoccus aerilatus]|uniref:hypothetical protein n=1 Tax=Muricoccus aerilatus TaxID=452982 RepID=UPI00069434F2|nr:hypothetical protein [Roseomonas aerilata]